MGSIRDQFNEILEDALEKTSAVVRKQGNRWCVFSKTGKNLGCYPTKQEAQERLRQVEFFKHKNDNNK